MEALAIDTTPAASGPLTTTERGELEELERSIEAGLNTFVTVGRSLMEIRDRKLYRGTHGTFEDYCRERWSVGRAQAYRLMNAAEVVANLSPTGDISPTSERQARELARLEPEQQQQAWDDAVAAAGDKQPTSAEVRNAAQRLVSGFTPDSQEEVRYPEAPPDEDAAGVIGGQHYDTEAAPFRDTLEAALAPYTGEDGCISLEDAAAAIAELGIDGEAEDEEEEETDPEPQSDLPTDPEERARQTELRRRKFEEESRAKQAARPMDKKVERTMLHIQLVAQAPITAEEFIRYASGQQMREVLPFAVAARAFLEGIGGGK